MPTLPNPKAHLDRPSGFTLVELLVVIGIISLLISILLPSLKRARQAAERVQCMSNLRQLALGVQLYCDDNHGFFPNSKGYDAGNPASGVQWYPMLSGRLGGSWPAVVYINHAGYATGRGVYFCPSNRADYSSGSAAWTNYAFNSNLVYSDWDGSGWQGVRRTAVRKNNALFTDSYRPDGNSTYYANAGARFTWPWLQTYAVHGTGQNIVFLDGHAEWANVEPHLPEPQAVDTDCGDMKAQWFWPLY